VPPHPTPQRGEVGGHQSGSANHGSQNHAFSGRGGASR